MQYIHLKIFLSSLKIEKLLNSAIYAPSSAFTRKGWGFCFSDSGCLFRNKTPKHISRNTMPKRKYKRVIANTFLCIYRYSDDNT